MKKLYFAFILAMFCFAFSKLYAQAPNISYATPQVYAPNITIAALVPTNTGGAVPPPASVYGQVTTIAGSGAVGSANGTGTAASFNSPSGISVDPSGNIYVADWLNNLVRKITPTGVVTTLAGSGFAGSTNGTGTSTSFNNPTDVSADAAGNVYVADYFNHLIRKITPAGVVTTLAGNGVQGSTDGPAASASFNYPSSVCADGSGSVYVSDKFTNLIRKISAAGVVSTIAGNGSQGAANGPGASASFYHPTSLALDQAGNLYVADCLNNLIRKITPAGIVSTFAGSGAQGSANGTGTAASFNTPTGLSVDPSGNVYVADYANNLIRKITAAGAVTTLAGSGSAGLSNGTGGAASFNKPYYSWVDVSGNVIIADQVNNMIRKINVTGGFSIDKALPAGLAFDPATGAISGTPTVTSPATNYTVTAYNATGSSTTLVNIAVFAATPQTITFPAIAIKTYGVADFAPGATASSGLPITYTSSNTAVAIITGAGTIHVLGVGSTSITASQSGGGNYAPATSITQTLTVIPANLTVTADSKTKLYGAANPPLIITYTGFVNGETVANLVTPATAVTVAATLPVNIYQITPSGASSPNYYISYVIGSLTVTPAPIIITVDNLIKISGQVNPPLTFTYSGFVNGDGPSSLSNFPVLQTTATTASPAGNYPITAQGAVNPNYTITYVQGTLKVLAAQTIAFSPIPVKTYGDADFTLAATATSGLPVAYTGSNPAVATVTPSGTVHIVGVGSTTITVSQAGNASYGAAPSVTQTLTVIPATLTFTANNLTKIYASANPTLTVSYSGFAYGETSAVLTAQPIITTTAVLTSNVGTYAITVGGAASANYTVAYIPGTLTVTPAALTVTADNFTKTSGQPNPQFTFKYSGFVNGDGPANVTTPPVLQTTANTSSPAGLYPITASGALSANYNISYVPGVLTVLLAQTITFAPVVKTYGDADFALPATASSGLPLTFTTSNSAVATVSSAGAVHIVGVGTAAITVSQAGSSAYGAAPSVTQTLTVTPATLTVTANSQTKLYATANPALTVSYSGFAYGETSSVLTAQPVVTTTAVVTSNVGTYPVTASGAVGSNYTIVYLPGTLTITQATRTLTFNALPGKTYGDADFSLGATVSNGDAVVYTTSDPAIATIVSGKVHIVSAGSITITATAVANLNYVTLLPITQPLFIKKATQYISFSPIPDQIRGGPDVILNVTASSGLPVIVSSSNIASALVNGLNVKLIDVGFITLYATQVGDNNYLPATASQWFYIGNPLLDLVFVHPLVTPNGDGINDVLLIEGIKNYPDNKLTITNKNGVKVYETTTYDNFTNFFNGYSSITSTPQPQGTYFYSLQFNVNGQTQKRLGFFVLKF